MIKAACTSHNRGAGCFYHFKRLFIAPQKLLAFVFAPKKAACTSKCPAELDKHVAFAVGIEKMVAADTLPHTDDLRGNAGKLDFAVRHGHAGRKFAVSAQDAEPVCGVVAAAADADMGGGGEPGRPLLRPAEAQALAGVGFSVVFRLLACAICAEAEILVGTACKQPGGGGGVLAAVQPAAVVVALPA